MAVSLVAQLLISAAMAASAPADAAPPPPTCGSPIYDPANSCKIRPGIDGRAVLQCTALRDGSLKDCSVASETPPGQGFGAAALSYIQGVKIKPDDTRPEAGGTVNIPLHFKSPS